MVLPVLKSNNTYGELHLLHIYSALSWYVAHEAVPCARGIITINAISRTHISRVLLLFLELNFATSDYVFLFSLIINNIHDSILIFKL